MSERHILVCDGCDQSMEHGGRASALLVDVYGTGEDLDRLDFCLVCAQNVTALDIQLMSQHRRGFKLPDDSFKRAEALKKRLRGNRQ